jgi:hypothetical protein
VEQGGSPAAAVDSRGGGPWWSAGRRSAPEAGGFREGIVCGARRARSASGWQHSSAWRGHDPGASRRSIFVLGVTSREDDSDANRIARTMWLVIASASEAIQRSMQTAVDCFVADAPRNDASCERGRCAP